MWEWFKNLGKNIVTGIVNCGTWIDENAGKIACTGLGITAISCKTSNLI